jgi:Tfp pilus assembly protein PilN
MLDLIDVLNKWGPVGGLLAVTLIYVVRDWSRINNLEQRIVLLEQEYRRDLTNLLQRTEETLAFNNKLLEKMLKTG